MHIIKKKGQIIDVCLDQQEYIYISFKKSDYAINICIRILHIYIYHKYI